MANLPQNDAYAMHIYQWAQAKQLDITRAFAMKGGWEGWLQVELGLYLAKQQYILGVDREKHVFDNANQKADLYITSNPPAGPHKIVIELKCESQYQDCQWQNNTPVLNGGLPVPRMVQGGMPSIAGRLQQELVGIQAIAQQYKPCQVACIGFSNTQGARQYATAGQQAGHPQFLALGLGGNLMMCYWTVNVA